MIEALYRSRAECRSADLVTLTPTAVPALSAPTDAQISAYYDAHKDAFHTGRTRFHLATLKLDRRRADDQRVGG